MQYRKLANGVHAVGFNFEKRFIVYASAFDEREARALVKAVRSVFELFHKTSGAYFTFIGTTEIPRGASVKVAAKKQKKRKRTNKISDQKSEGLS